MDRALTCLLVRRLVRRTLRGVSALAIVGCLNDLPVGAGAPNVRASLNVVGGIAGGTVRIRVGYRTSRQGFVALPSSPEEVTLAGGTTVVVPLTVDIGPCLADAERSFASEPGCRLTLELTLSDGGTVLDTQIRDARGSAGPGESVDFGTVTVGITVSAVTVAPISLGLIVSQEQQLTATVRDANGAITTSAQVSWTTSDATVAQLSAATGSSVLVRALKLGSASVTASAGGKTSNVVTVNVVPPAPLVIRQRPAAGCVIVGQTVTLEVDTPPGPVTWSIANATVATIGAASGIVTGVAGGQTTGTATSGLRTGTASVCVVGPLAVTPQSVAITSGRTSQLTVANASGGSVSFASNATPIATVDATGLVRGVGVGQATITTTLTAGSGTQTATTPVSVTAANVAVSPATASAAINQTARYTAIVTDANGATVPNVAVTWSIVDATVGSLSTPSGATVDVRALKLGGTTVRATIGTLAASAQFTATPPLPASRLEKVAGDGAICPTASTSCTFVVRAVDVNGVPVAGAGVNWTAPAGCGASRLIATDANGLSTTTNICSTVATGAYTQTATLVSNQQQASFSFTLRGLTLTLQSINSFGAHIYNVTSASGPASGLKPSVAYRVGPAANYVTQLDLSQTVTPATLTVRFNEISLPSGNYVFDVIVSTTTSGIGPGITTIAFSDTSFGFIQPNGLRQRNAAQPTIRSRAP